MPNIRTVFADLQSLQMNFLDEHVQALSVSVTKDWHYLITHDFRTHLVKKLVIAIIPKPDPALILNKCMQNIIAYAKNFEKDIYEKAIATTDYFEFLSKEISKLQKDLTDLEEKRQKQPEQQMQSARMALNLGATTSAMAMALEQSQQTDMGANNSKINESNQQN